MTRMTFNLDPPPGFRGLDSQRSVSIYTRNLPHWRQTGATYFVTFHLADALPAAKRNELASMRREWEHRNRTAVAWAPGPCALPHGPGAHATSHHAADRQRNEAAWTEYAKTVFRKVERWMDAGHGKCWFRQPQYAAELRRTILHFHEKRYEVGCFVIMANHCHLAIRPFDDCELEEEVGAMKSAVANLVNKQEGRQGPLWQQESYDRIIRDEEHLYRVVQYIGTNPRLAGIARDAWDRWIHPKWQALGWDFRDELKL